MTIDIITNYNENRAIKNITTKCTDICGDDAAKEMLEESKKFGIKTESLLPMSTTDGNAVRIIIPDKVVNATLKIISKLFNFISILKPIVTNFVEDIEDEVESLEDLKADDKKAEDTETEDQAQ